MACPFLLALTTAPSVREAQKLADLILTKRVAACVNILPSLKSYYWWKGKKECASEVILFIKTRKSAFRKLEAILRKNHSYSVPEIIAIPILAGSKPYLAWLGGEIR